MSGTTDSQSLSEIYGYPIPDTWVPGQSINADWLNRNIRDPQIFLTYAPLTIVERAATQSLSNGVETNITWDTEVVDTSGMFSNPSTNLVVTEPGVYALQHSVDFAANATSIRATHIAVNGNTISEIGGDASTTSDTGLVCSAITPLAAGDIITAFSYQSSGAALNIQGGTRLSARLISTTALDLTFSTTTGGSSSSTPTTPTSSKPTAPAPTKHTSTFWATWSRSYDGDGSTTWDDSKHCYQGYYSSDRGNTRSLVGFNYGSIESTLAGATRITGKFGFKVAHSYYNSGLTAVVGSHKYTSKPSSWSSSNVYQNQIRRSSCVAGKTYSVNLSDWHCWAFRTGAITGMAFGPGPSSSKTYYGYMYGGTEAAKPYVQFTYYK